MKKLFFLLLFVSLAFSASVFQDFSLTVETPLWTGHGFTVELSLIKDEIAYIHVSQYTTLSKVSKGSVFGPFTVLNLTNDTVTFRYEEVSKSLNSVVNRAVDSWIKDQGFSKSNVVKANLGKKGKTTYYAAFYRTNKQSTIQGISVVFRICTAKTFAVISASDSFIAARLPGDYICT